MAIRMRYIKHELKHKIEYTFLCQSCGKQSGIIDHVFNVEYTHGFQVSTSSQQEHPNESYPKNETASRRIVENKLLDLLRDAYLSARKGEFHLFNSNGEAHAFLSDLSNACPHCKTKQTWRKKRKGFFSKEFIEVQPKHLPQINWHFEAVKSDMLDYITWYMAFLRMDDNDIISKDEKVKRITQEKVLRAIDVVTEGMGEHLLEDLMMCKWPLVSEAGSLIRPANAPTLRAGEKAYGYCGVDHNWWIIVRDHMVSKILIQ